VMAAHIILRIETEEPDQYDFEFLAEYVLPYRRFFADPSSSSSSSSMLSSSSSSSTSSSPSSSPRSGYVQNPYRGSTIASAHQCTSSRCTECAEARPAGFNDNEARLIHHKPCPSPAFLPSSLVSATHQIENRGIFSLSDSIPAPPSLTSERIGSLNQSASEIVGRGSHPGILVYLFEASRHVATGFRPCSTC
jgi:hypothetical protein